MTENDVFSYVKAEENRYLSVPVPVVSGYSWHMYEHVRLTTLYLNSQFKTGAEDDKPFRNIILPKVNLEHRAVNFDLSEIEFYINSDEDYKSFLVKKWHDRWANQNGIDEFLDEMSDTYTDYGGVLLKNLPDTLEVVPFQRLAFVDQTDILSGPICEKHEYSPDQLMAMAGKGWKNLEEVIALAREEKTNTQTTGGFGSNQTPKALTPGRYIEVYELHGMLPETFLNPQGDKNKFTRQMHILTFYQSKTSENKLGIPLYQGKEKESLYKVYKRDKIWGRALGRGAVEELFEPQVWANAAEIAKSQYLTAVSKVINWTNDPSFKAKNGPTTDLDNGTTLEVSDGKTFARVDTNAANIEVFENAFQSWNQQAQQLAATTDLMSGSSEGSSNMPAKLGIPLIEEGHSLHEYRKKRLGGFLKEVYRDWILPKCVKSIEAGDEWMDDLSIDEMNQIVDQVVCNQFNETLIGKVLAGQIVYPQDAQALEQTYRQEFFKSSRKFLKIFESEFKDLPIEIEVNVARSGPNALMAQKLGAVWSNIVNVLAANPNFFQQQPQMAKIFNAMLKAYGLSPINFGVNKIYQTPQPQPSLKPPQNANQSQPQVQGQPQVAGQYGA